jgi:hypothetical protein
MDGIARSLPKMQRIGGTERCPVGSSCETHGVRRSGWFKLGLCSFLRSARRTRGACQPKQKMFIYGFKKPGSAGLQPKLESEMHQNMVICFGCKRDGLEMSVGANG